MASLRKWRIAKSYIERGQVGAGVPVVITGPRGCPDDDQDARFSWTRFRLYDDDGILYYEGEMNEHCDGFDPLDEFGMPNAGCTEVRVLTPGKGWQRV